MRLVLWANGPRGVTCLEALAAAGRRPALVVAHPRRADGEPNAVELAAAGLGIAVISPSDPHGAASLARLRREAADVFVLAGYGKILGADLLALPRRTTVNLHAGALPEYRGSSPLNWALINGERSFKLSVIEVDRGVDTGDVLAEQQFPIDPDDTISDLHAIANREFAELLLSVLEDLESGILDRQEQEPDRARYFPLRFPEDGFVLWDQLTARQVHNRVRALRPPYPGAFTYHQSRRVTLISTQLPKFDFRGEPGRIYRKSDRGLLVCARDRCLWVTEARFDDDDSPLLHAVQRYDQLATMRQAALEFYSQGTLTC